MQLDALVRSQAAHVRALQAHSLRVRLDADHVLQRVRQRRLELSTSGGRHAVAVPVGCVVQRAAVDELAVRHGCPLGSA